MIALSEQDNDSTKSLPRLRSSVSVMRTGPNTYTVRDLSSRTYFQAGEQEAFLIEKLRAETTWGELQAEFHRQFAEEIHWDDFAAFRSILNDRKLIIDSEGKSNGSPNTSPSSALDDDDEDDGYAGNRGSILYYRIPLVDPDRFLESFASRFPFLWTKTFLAVAGMVMVFAFGVMIESRHELLATLKASLYPSSAIVVFVAVVAATAIHEIGHGATCKRFGGSVHESGVLFLFLMPCLYVNVSDAWFIPEKSRRLAITFAGGFCDLCIWAIAVLVWRATQLNTQVNYVSFILLTTCGTRAFLNFNPMLRLDGYYLLSDLLDYPNLYTIARKYWVANVQHFLWGAPKPVAPKWPWLVILYGLNTWFFALVFLNYMAFKLIGLASSQFGITGVVVALLMFSYAIKRVTRGFIGSELYIMLKKRTWRTVAWIVLIVGVGLASLWIPVQSCAVGDFEVRSAFHQEVSSPSNSFISLVAVKDGDCVEKGDVLVELYAPDLTAQISAKQFELQQSKATLEKLETGARPEEISLVKAKVRMLKDWCTLGEQELETAKRVLESELEALKHRSEQVALQVGLAKEVLKKSEELKQKGAVAGAQVMQEKAKLEVLKSQLAELESNKTTRERDGVRKEVAELSRRRQQLSEAETSLAILLLGTRPEELEAERARNQKLSSELQYLEEQARGLVVRSPVSGLVSAPRLRERVGQFAPRGSILCQIENPEFAQVEIFVSEDDATKVQRGQQVKLKARGLPFETFEATVERLSPAAAKPQEAVASQQVAVKQAVVVHCTLTGTSEKLKAGMTGFGRIYNGKDKLANYLVSRVYRYVRTEFWW